MQRIFAGPSSSDGGVGSGAFCLEPFFFNGLDVGVSASSMFLVCWPFVARAERLVSSVKEN